MRPLSDRDALIAEIEIETAETAPLTGRRKLSARLLAALRKVPREAFIPEADIAHAYVNTPLPIGHGQTISQPFVVAIMTELLDLEPDHCVLEIGTGSGYQAAILSRIAREVVSVERFRTLADAARDRLKTLGYANVTIITGDGFAGASDRAPFDRIMVTAAADEVPDALVAQLTEGGKMVLPLGPRNGPQYIVKLTKKPDGELGREELIAVRFVPLLPGQAKEL